MFNILVKYCSYKERKRERERDDSYQSQLHPYGGSHSSALLTPSPIHSLFLSHFPALQTILSQPLPEPASGFIVVVFSTCLSQSFNFSPILSLPLCDCLIFLLYTENTQKRGKANKAKQPPLKMVKTRGNEKEGKTFTE